MGNAIFLLLYWQFVCFLWKQQMVEIAFFSTGITIHSYFVIWIRLDWVGKIFWFKSHFALHHLAIFPRKLGFYQIYFVFCAQQLIYCPQFHFTHKTGVSHDEITIFQSLIRRFELLIYICCSLFSKITLYISMNFSLVLFRRYLQRKMLRWLNGGIHRTRWYHCKAFWWARVS